MISKQKIRKIDKNYEHQKQDYFSIILPLILIFAFIAMLMVSWLKWADVLVDFGRELYLPWRICSGDMLYKDMAHLFGPFSPYFNAFIFKIFGVSYFTLILFNIVILGMFILILYIVLTKTTSRAAAFMSCFVVITVFAFSQYSYVGNYNYISPYSHEAIHGVMLSLLSIYLLYSYSINKKLICLMSAGLLLGIVFLTKPEIFLAALCSSLLYFLLLLCKIRNNKSFMIKSLTVFFISSILPLICFTLYFYTEMSLTDSLRNICRSYVLSINKSIINSTFYAINMGFYNLEVNLYRLIYFSLIAILCIILAMLSTHFYKKYKHKNFLSALCLSYLSACVLIVLFYLKRRNVGIPIPVLILVIFAILLYKYIRLSKVNDNNSSIYLLLLLLSVFSGLLLMKTIFNARIEHYGFYLSLPSVILLIVMIIWFLPEFLKKKGEGALLFRNVMILIIIIIVGKFVFSSNGFYRMKTFSIGKNYDRIKTYEQTNLYFYGYAIKKTINWINDNIGKKETFAVLPEGVMLNYLTRRKNPTKYTNFMMPELICYGENNIIKDFEFNSPDYIILIHQLPSEQYGVGHFGKGSLYGEKIMKWINKNYKSCKLFGNEPFMNEKFGVKILIKRRLSTNQI